MAKVSYDIYFEENAHLYIMNGEVAPLSVTTLLHNHHIGKDYSNIDTSVLKNKASRGTAIHKDIQNVVENPNFEPTTNEGRYFKEYIAKKYEGMICEVLIGIDFKGLMICGQADFIAVLKDNTIIIGDFKTYYEMDSKALEGVTWQVSIYDYMLKRADEINGKNFEWYKGANEFQCIWFDSKIKDEPNYKILDLEKIPDEEIEKLFMAELNNKTYEKKQLVISDDFKMQLVETEIKYAQLENQLKELKKKREEFNKQVLEYMEAQKINNWESPNGLVKITYVASYLRNGIDSAKLKKEYPNAYTACYKSSPVKSSIKVTTDLEKYEELKANEFELDFKISSGEE